MLLVALVLAGASLGPACAERPRDGTIPSLAAPDRGVAATAPTKAPEVSLALLRRPHSAWSKALGAHRLTLEATTHAAVKGYPRQKVHQKLTLVVDGKGGVALTKTLGDQQGFELVLAGGTLYTRLRYSTFLRRKPARAEVARLLDRLSDPLAATLELVGSRATLTPGEETTVAGRPARRYTLGLGEQAAAPSESSPSRRWRTAVEVTALSGGVTVDRATGAPLAATLSATWRFVPPKAKPLPKNGIPAQLDPDQRGEGGVTLTLALSELGAVKQPVTAPPEDQVLTSLRRRRLELERQMLTGELPIPADWRKVR